LERERRERDREREREEIKASEFWTCLERERDRRQREGERRALKPPAAHSPPPTSFFHHLFLFLLLTCPLFLARRGRTFRPYRCLSTECYLPRIVDPIRGPRRAGMDFDGAIGDQG
jgi:hypothetical protein